MFNQLVYYWFLESMLLPSWLTLEWATTNIYIYQTSPPQVRWDTRSVFLNRVKLVWIESFPFFLTVCLMQTKGIIQPYYLLIVEQRINGFILFPWNEMKCKQLRLWFESRLMILFSTVITIILRMHYMYSLTKIYKDSIETYCQLQMLSMSPVELFSYRYSQPTIRKRPHHMLRVQFTL